MTLNLSIVIFMLVKCSRYSVFPKGPDIANVIVIGGTVSGKGGKLAIDYLNEFVKRKFPDGKFDQVVGAVPVGDSSPQLVADESS